MSLLPLIFSSSWASGINAYLVVLVLGVAERFGHFAQIPDLLGNAWVLGIAGTMFCLEAVADKIPYLDSSWDAISTFIRPAIAAGLAALISGDATSLEQLGYSALGATTALASHTVKAGTRLAINTSPEPASNVVASVGEDAGVLTVAVLAIHYPWVAFGISATLLVLGLILLIWIGAKVRRGWRRWKGRPLPARR